MQQDTAQQYPQITQQPGAAQQAQQQDGTMSTAAPSLMTADSKMKVAQDAHREYRKAGEHVQTAHQLLRIVSGQTQQGSLSPQAIAHLTQAKWVEAVKKAIGDYQHTERTLQRAVKVLKVCFSQYAAIERFERFPSALCIAFISCLICAVCCMASCMVVLCCQF